jgi:hypothetical protein
MNITGAFGAVRQLWPLKNASIVWPLATLSDVDTNRLANVLKEFMFSPLAEWRTLSTNL